MKRSTSSPPPITLEDHSTSPRASPKLLSESFLQSTRNDNVPKHGLAPNKATSWQHRKRSPGVKWHEKWTENSWKNGRVLLIDYLKRDNTQDHKLKVSALEFQRVEDLEKFYDNPELSKTAALRLIHVQNASWATQYLLRKFNIDHSDDLVGTAFGRWARFEKPQLRAGKPVLNGKTFGVQRDPWRGITRTGFGLDYLRHYPCNTLTKAENDLKMMELNHYNAEEVPSYGYDVFVQRISVYIQRSDGGMQAPDDPEIKSPYRQTREDGNEQYRKPRGIDHSKINALDNGNTIIIFEHSTSGSISDTLIGAREQLESRWRRLTFYLPKEDILTDDLLALQCMNYVMRDIFKGLSFAWEKYMSLCETHVSILEEKVYENPADESRAPELWHNSKLWLKVEKLMFIHIDVIKELKAYLRELTEEEPPDGWLANTQEEFEKLANLVQEDLVKPTSNLSDLMYKSVEIRDSRESLQLGTSMWRLSWITFIFLPLTFIVGFFGMNVDTFQDNPSIKWYFISSVPLMFVVLLLWYTCKHSLAYRHQDPLRRGLYESLYHDLAEQHPDLWTTIGPRTDAVPRGLINSIKWKFLNYWFAPEKTIMASSNSQGQDHLGGWALFKNLLLLKWLRKIEVSHYSTVDLGESAIGHGHSEIATELIDMPSSTNGTAIHHVPGSQLPLSPPLQPMESSSPSPTRPSSRPSSQHSGVVMLEEKPQSDDGSQVSESEHSRSLENRLGIPQTTSANFL